jgi:hypothetical protein
LSSPTVFPSRPGMRVNSRIVSAIAPILLVLRPVLRRFNHQTGQWEDTKEQGYYLVQTYWQSEQDFWNWTKSESFRIAHSNRPPAEMFAGANVLEIHEVILTTEKQ